MKKAIHPNDHVNMGQCTNDMFPTAIHVAVAVAIKDRLLPALRRLHATLAEKAARVGQDHQDRPHPSGRRHAAAARAGSRRLRPANRTFARAGRAGDRGRARVAGRRNGRRHGDQHPSGIRPPRGRRLGQRDGHPFRRSRATISRPTPSATGWSNATASCARSPSRCSTWRTTSAGSAPGRAAVSMKSCFPIASRAARSCRAR